MVASSNYARPELLADTEWLARHLDDPNLRVVDCDNRDAYRRAHIPGAVHLGHPMLPEPKMYLKDPDAPVHVLPAEKLALVMGDLGIGNDTLVVAYDGFGGLYAARLWWVLGLYGHTSVKVLNGGWRKWLAEGRPITNAEARISKASFTPRACPEFMATCDYLLGCVENPRAVILDVRSDAEWTGENPRGNARAGHIPGAVHLEWLNFITQDDLQTFRPVDELRTMLEAAGVTSAKEVVTH